jgi:hypothetical protein
MDDCATNKDWGTMLGQSIPDCVDRSPHTSTKASGRRENDPNLRPVLRKQ